MDLRFATAALLLLAVPPAVAETSPSSAGAVAPAAERLATPAAIAEAKRLAAEPPTGPAPAHTVVEDHTGRKEEGKASIYAHSFDGRKMADGNHYNPDANVAASKQLPLGTVAKVTNLDTHETATVKIEDHGPYVGGRVVDLTPHVAKEIGLSQSKGVAPVVVAPVVVPQPGGGAKLGAGAVSSPTSRTDLTEADRK